jgi:hypothetical protein
VGSIWVRALLAVACATLLSAGNGEHTAWVIEAPADLPSGTRLAVADLRHDLARWGAPVSTRALGTGRCAAGEVQILVLGHTHDRSGQRTAAPLLPTQDYTIEEERCGSGRRVVLAGGSLMAGQWAVYDFLERLGVRYFHPEQTYYPPRPVWPAQPMQVHAQPAFRDRSMHLHGDHPVELSPPRELAGLPMADYQRRWIDWNVKLRQTLIDGGFDPALVGAYPYERGFPRVVGLNLANGQQGGHPVLDMTDPRPEATQIGEAIDRLLAPAAGLPDASMLTVQFNPSEFTQADEDRTVERLDIVARYVAQHHPAVRLFTINHGTHQELLPKHGVRFFDLSQFAPAKMGVLVHPLMLYDLQRPAAGVYGNADFGHLQRWVLAQQAKRPIVYYPESSWWLTFDEAVPLYLAPATLEARQWDLRWLAPVLADHDGARTGVVGHHLFTSGQEWGYWLIDYCVAHMTWNLGFTHDRCVDDFTGQLAGATELRAVLHEVEERQVKEVRDPEVLRFLVGSDDEIETAESMGLHFHPLPPAPAEVVGWSDAQIQTLRERSLAPLARIAVAYNAFADRVEAQLRAQSPEQAPWVREMRDGLRAYGLRAEHAVAVYEGVLAVRAATRSRVPAADAHLDKVLSRARALTEAARVVVRRRESEYRYPAALATAGGERGSADALANRTIYPYRYLSRTHRLFYWTRPDDQLAALVRAARNVPPAGGGGVAAAQAEREGRLARFPRGSLHIESPTTARRLEGLLPGLQALMGDDGAPFLELAALDAARAGAPATTAWRAERSGSHAGPADLALMLGTVGDLVVRDATVEVGSSATSSRAAELIIRGRLKIDDIVDLMVKAGGFERSGARVVLAVTLGFLPGRLPETFPISLRALGAFTAG